ncbi:GrpB family protein [Stenotrophomonas sp. Y-13]|uniref:GrpB family protein n=1 Tax=Stenotrophomonas sp. Y-13 TaxID=3384161 RepID=UPI0039170DB2
MDEQESLVAAINEEVKLCAYNSAWPSLYEEERQRLHALLPGTIIDIQHIGSTSVPGLMAKPIIDILAGVASMEVAESIGEVLCKSGYTTSAEFNRSLTDRKWFMRWANGHRTHHLHVVVHAGPVWSERLKFRNALRADPDLAAKYEKLKVQMTTEHSQDREAYTDAKAHFVQAVSRAA